MMKTERIQQTYNEYLETMREYKFIPLDKKTWENWQLEIYGKIKE